MICAAFVCQDVLTGLVKRANGKFTAQRKKIWFDTLYCFRF